MRDTTKWLVALVPGAGLFVVVTDLVPKIAGVELGTAAFWWACAMTLVAAAAAAWMVGSALKVFSAGVPGWGEAVRRAGGGTTGPAGPATMTLATQLDADGVVYLYGYPEARKLFEELAQGDKPAPTAMAAAEVVVDYAGYRGVRASFLLFLKQGAVALVVGIVAIAGAEAAAARAPETHEAISVTSPTPLEVRLNRAGSDALRDRLGCSPPPELVGWAIGGRMNEPLIVLDDGQGPCTATETPWNADWGELVPASSPGRN